MVAAVLHQGIPAGTSGHQAEEFQVDRGEVQDVGDPGKPAPRRHPAKSQEDDAGGNRG